jgi:hypothetical protein
MPIIPATQEAEVEGLWFEALSGKKKKKQSKKRLGVWIMCMTPQVQAPVLPNK